MSLGSDYEDAVRGGRTDEANYLAQALAANAGININTNSVTAAPASLLHTATAPAGGGGGFWGGIGDTLSGITHSLGPLGDLPIIPGVPFTPNQITGVVDGVSGAASGASAAVKFITDIPRVATTILGLILVIAGVFALTRGPAVNIVTSAVRGAVTS